MLLTSTADQKLNNNYTIKRKNQDQIFTTQYRLENSYKIILQ